MPPEDLAGYREVKAALDIPIAGGEAEFTRWGFRPLITERLVDILQPDIAAAGGISETKKIADMANAFGVRVNPHVWGTGGGARRLAAADRLPAAQPAGAAPDRAAARIRPVRASDPHGGPHRSRSCSATAGSRSPTGRGSASRSTARRSTRFKVCVSRHVAIARVAAAPAPDMRNLATQRAPGTRHAARPARDRLPTAPSGRLARARLGDWLIRDGRFLPGNKEVLARFLRARRRRRHPDRPRLAAPARLSPAISRRIADLAARASRCDERFLDHGIEKTATYIESPVRAVVEERRNRSNGGSTATDALPFPMLDELRERGLYPLCDRARCLRDRHWSTRSPGRRSGPAGSAPARCGSSDDILPSYARSPRLKALRRFIGGMLTTYVGARGRPADPRRPGPARRRHGRSPRR